MGRPQRPAALVSPVLPQHEDRPDGELVRLCQTGSLTAFEALVYRYEGRIYRFVANLCRNHADAAEITQDAFLRAFQALAQFDSSQPLAPWLFTIARRKCIDHFRAAAPPATEAMPELADPDTPAETLARREEGHNLWQLAQRRLSATQFQALWLKYAEDLSVAEIAQVLRLSQTHVKVILFRARLALGQELAAQPASPAPAAATTKTPAAPKPALAGPMLGH